MEAAPIVMDINTITIDFILMQIPTITAERDVEENLGIVAVATIIRIERIAIKTLQKMDLITMASSSTITIIIALMVTFTSRGRNETGDCFLHVEGRDEPG